VSSRLPADVTRALSRWSDGAPEALEGLMPMVYDELRKLARRHLRRHRPGNTLQPTVLVHEAYLKLADRESPPWKDRIHFFAVVAKVMRGILVDHARARTAAKRGGGDVQVTLGGANEVADPRATDLLVLDEALSRLAELDPRKARLIELRCFGGLTIEETAKYLQVSSPTVIKETRKAKAWLHKEMVPDPAGGAADGL